MSWFFLSGFDSIFPVDPWKMLTPCGCDSATYCLNDDDVMLSVIRYKLMMDIVDKNKICIDFDFEKNQCRKWRRMAQIKNNNFKNGDVDHEEKNF